jgi:hypothetical protein
MSGWLRIPKSIGVPNWAPPRPGQRHRPHTGEHGPCEKRTVSRADEDGDRRITVVRDREVGHAIAVQVADRERGRLVSAIERRKHGERAITVTEVDGDLAAKLELEGRIRRDQIGVPVTIEVTGRDELLVGREEGRRAERPARHPETNCDSPLAGDRGVRDAILIEVAEHHRTMCARVE